MKKVLPFILLHAIIFIYSLGGICSKTAASKDFLSLEWIMLYGLVLLSLAVYALVWQQVLKMLPLNLAYASKSVTVIWGMFWGALIFGETITVPHVIGALIILAGIVLMVTGERGKNGEEQKND